MKATGIVRRIDELGRIVIPKEIRRTLRIKEGDPLEIFTNRDGELILKKYSPINELEEVAQAAAKALAESTGHIVLISDKDTIVAGEGITKSDFIGKAVSSALDEVMASREHILLNAADSEIMPLKSDDAVDEYVAEVIVPIVSDGAVIGSVILACVKQGVVFTETEKRLAEVAALFLSKQSE